MVRLRYILAITLLLAFGGGFLLIRAPDAVPDAAELKANTFAHLHDIRLQRKADIERLLEDLQKEAYSIENDGVMVSLFFNLLEKRGAPQEEYKVDERYVEQYGDFYDILFVDAAGIVFYSVKKEDDFSRNLFKPPYGTTHLSDTLLQATSKSFSEFEYYSPSDEPAAFFTVPVKDKEVVKGWFVLQLAANRLNTVLTDRSDLGATGEVYLVNDHHFMLTDSRFVQKSTILRQRVDTDAVILAFRSGEGAKIVTDYRGKAVFSSFERLDIFGKHWALIAEIDESEILTDFYRRHEDLLLEKILDTASARKIGTISSGRIPAGADTIRVDMNEFHRADADGTLVTYGVATCSALAVSFPGRFGYLAHLAPTDKVYRRGWWDMQNWRHDFASDLLGELFAKITYYDLTASELSKLQVDIVVPHRQSVAALVSEVLEAGLFLENIRLLYSENARSANVLFRVNSSNVTVQWNMDKGYKLEESAQVKNMNIALKRVIGYHS